jgi:hypothetical protein
METTTRLKIILFIFCLSSSVQVHGAVGTILARSIGIDNENTQPPAGNGTVGQSKDDAARAGAPGNARSGGQSAPDLKLERKIRQALDDAGFNDIKVSVSQGTITLRGDAANEEERRRILSAVKTTGAKDKDIQSSQLKVNPTGNITGTNTSLDGNRNGNGKTANSQGNTSNTNTNVENQSLWETVTGLILPLLVILAALLVIGMLGYAIWSFVQHTRALIDGYFRGVRKKQDELSTKLDTSTLSLKKEFNERLGELKDQIRILSITLKEDRREILDGVHRSSAAASSAYQGYSDQMSAPKENVHTFPAAADEYLSKVRQSAMIVKPDFQNGILVQDPDGKGELVLVEDRSTPGGLLYVVPKVGYFQTKQDFFNYYEKYYECYRPSSGEVWINVPAVVDKVTGGWELRDKGELEIR